MKTLVLVVLALVLALALKRAGAKHDAGSDPGAYSPKLSIENVRRAPSMARRGAAGHLYTMKSSSDPDDFYTGLELERRRVRPKSEKLTLPRENRDS